ncbi:putative bifunctional diguanylate cyclase/phosphodiesterase [Steroidobacter sp.]|uniref:putative bifunctional diguanylate cyclase/phosphodiesterase n=1 Tax=Steroidobacter sp. TaxID=1978227 RepID=UPI002ED91F44
MPSLATALARLRQWRPGMALRLATGFAAVALTVVVANISTQQSTRQAQEKVRQLLIQHEPLVRATESLAAAVSMYERTVIDQSESSVIAQQPVKAAVQRMTDAARQYQEAAAHFPELDRPAPEFDAELASLVTAGDELLRSSVTRRSRMRDYWQRFEALEASLNAPQAKAVRFAGAVFASEKLMDLTRTLAGIREQVSAAASLSSPRSAQLIIASENAFRTRLEQHSSELAKLHGQEWLAQVKTKFNAVVAGRRVAFESIETLNEQSVMFRDQAAAIAGLVVTQLVEPARHALADADRLAVLASDRADRHLGWASSATLILLLIIAVATVTGVTAPVRRLTHATRRLAGGAVGTRVARGGMRELDTLAEAFNQMAEQLQQAQNAVRVHQLELETRVVERTRELNHLAHHDPLTDLPNRRHLLAHLDDAISRARLRSSRFALLFIDLDNFKTINDSMGHAFGDRVLQVVSERLRMNSLFSRSFCARLGGDEFTVVCEEVNQLGDVERLSRSVLEEFQRSLSVHGRELRISVSVGACIYPDHASDSHALLRAADSALFRAKELGRNCASMYAPQLLEAAASRFKVEQSLRRAVERGEFELLYQPEVCFESLDTHTVEALLRWRQPDGNVVSPADFFAVAEQTGLIADISDWALRTAIQTAAVWHRGPWPKARVAVNISSQQLIGASFVSRLQSLLDQYHLPPQCLEIELTENVLQTGANTIATLKRLRELGVFIALDDFGTGYSSLTSLERLPLTRVKIDRSLVATIDTGGRSSAIVRSIIGLCHSLGLQVTAEGVERPAQLGTLLTDRGVQVQGYLVSHPINAATVPVFIEQARHHLEQLMIAAPAPPQHAETNTTRLRTLRASTARGARAARPPADE